MREDGKKIVVGVAAYLVAKGVLNLILSGPGFFNWMDLVLQIILAVLIILGIRYANYGTAVILTAIVLWHLPANLRGVPGSWLYLTEGILDIGMAVLLVFPQSVKAYFSTRSE